MTPDWDKFRQAFMRGLPNADRLQSLEALERLLDLQSSDAMTEFQQRAQAITTRELYQDLILLNFTIQRGIGILPGPELNQSLQRLMQEAQQGSAPPERSAAARRLSLVWEMAGVLIRKDPSITQAPSKADIDKEQLQRAATAIFARLDSLQDQMAPGSVSPSSLQQQEGVLRDAKELLASAASDNQALPYVFYMTGMTARMLARCYAIAGRNQDALSHYAAAAEYFTKGSEDAQAEDCRRRAQELKQRLAGDLDTAAAEPLARLSETGTEGDPFDRIKALMQLVDVAGSAGDTFEAQENAHEAAAALTALGYLDPGQVGTDQDGVDQATNAWIDVAAKSATGVALLGRLSQVSTWYDGILGARYAELVRKNRSAADRLQQLQNQLHRFDQQTMEEARSSQAEHTLKLSRYFPQQTPAATEPNAEGAKRTFSDFLEECGRIDNALAQIRDTCNQRAGTGEPMDDLLAQLHTLQAESDGLNSPEYEAKTRLEEAYVLGHLARAAEIIPVAQEARRRLLAGRAESLSSFPQSHQRYLYLDSRMRELQGRMMSGDMAGGLEIAEATIRDYEAERYNVNNDFRQTAVLSYVADFYKWAALGAFKLQKWDNMLAAIDLIKARTAIRNRLLPDSPDASQSDILRAFEEASNAGASDAAARKQLDEKRRRLWDLLTITRGQAVSTSALPPLTVQSLQSALAPEQALVAYFWLSETVILTVAVDSGRFHAERIVLKPEEAALLGEFTAFIENLKAANRSMDKAVAKIGKILLPDFLREFIKTKQRVVFSPHHSLHLFPFHAVPWDGGFVGSEFAVSYVPNFSSILLPWTKQPENRILAIGIKQFADPAIRPLLNVEDDARAISEYYASNGAAVEMVLGPEVTRQRLQLMRDNGQLAGFRCIHLGTHGLSVFENPNQPLESSLLLYNGALDAMDIANLPLSAELAVLSACHSGQRAIQVRDLGEAPGDDIFGLQAALFKSGVRSILGTLWLVETSSASAVTREFHKRFAGGEPADVALQLSVKAYLSNSSVPQGTYFWAPYFIASLGTRQKGESTTDGRTDTAL